MKTAMVYSTETQFIDRVESYRLRMIDYNVSEGKIISVKI